MTRLQIAISLGLMVPLALGVRALRADEWEPARTQIHRSANGEYRLTTIPPGDAGNPEIDRKTAKCMGILEQKQKDGSFKKMWEKSLSNQVSPVSALVANSGQYVVTFDNWHRMGHGNNTVVIYGPKGKLVRELSLYDFLTAAEVRRLPISVSSVWWGNGHELDEKKGVVVLKVTGKSWINNNPAAKDKEVRLRLEDGKLVEEQKAESKKDR